MTDPKPVELTDTERAALMHHIGGWKFERQGLANAEDAFMTEVSRIVKARETAARREAGTEVANAFIAWAAKNEIAKPPLDWAWFGEIARRYSPLHEEHNAEETP